MKLHFPKLLKLLAVAIGLSGAGLSARSPAGDPAGGNADLGGPPEFAVNFIIPQPPQILTQPQSQAVLVNTDVQFFVGATGTAPLQYQWFFNNNPIPRATASTYQIVSVGVAQAGVYTVRVMNQLGTDLSAKADLVVNPGAQFCVDFNTGPVPPARLLGNAFIDKTGGVGNSGALKLTIATNGQIGSILIPNPNGGLPVQSFSAQFMSFVGGGTTTNHADGFSFNFAADLPEVPLDEEGAGKGLTVSFDTWDNGNREAPAIDVKWGGAVFAHFLTTGLPPEPARYVPVAINLGVDGMLEVKYNGTTFFRDFLPNYRPLNGQFALGARTGAIFDNHFIDDLCIAVLPFNQPPQISDIADRAINEDGTTGTISFGVFDQETPAASLLLTASSTDTGLVPATNIVFGGSATNRTVSVRPAPNRFGTTLITVTLSDAVGSTVSDSFLLTVNAVNDPPTLDQPANLVLAEDAGPQTVNLAGISSGATNENQVLTVTATNSNPALLGNVNVAYTSPNPAGTLSFTPAANASGSAIITVTVNDGASSNNLVSRSFTVTVNAVNDPPTLDQPANLTLPEDAPQQTINLTGIGSGAANETQVLTVTATNSNPALLGKLSVSYTSPNPNGTLSFTPLANASGSATITVTVNDGATVNNLVSRSVTVTVNAANNPPTLNQPANLTLPEDAPQQTVNLTGISSGAANETQVLTVKATNSNPALLASLSVNYTSPATNGTLSFTPAVNANGSTIVTVTVNDGGASNNLVSRVFTVTLNAVNDAPTLNLPNNVSLPEDAPQQTISLTGISSGATNENQGLTVTATNSNPALLGNLNVTYTSPNPTGTLSFTPVANASGSALITVTVNDGASSNNLVSRTFTVTVNAVNDPPTLDQPANLTLLEGAPQQTINLAGISSGAANETQVLTVTATNGNPALLGKLSVSYTSPNPNGTLSFTPLTNASGSATISVTVNDGASSNNLVSRAFVVTVNPKAPRLFAADAFCPEPKVTLTFTELLDPVSSVDPSRYTINGGNAVLSVALGGDPHVVSLHLSSPLAAGVNYTVAATVMGQVKNPGSSEMVLACDRCQRGSAGREFWLTFPGNYAVNPFEAPLPQLFIRGEAGTAGAVSAPGFDSPFTVEFVIPANGLVMVPLPRETDLADVSDVIEDKGVHILANRRVTVYGLNSMPGSSEGYLALPVPALGLNYVVMSYQNRAADSPDLTGVELALVATEDDTTVTLVPSATVGEHPSGEPFSYSLQRGQTFQLLNREGTPADLTGTLVFANKAIAVFGGHQCASIPNTNVFFGNHLVEQMPPADWWGAEFVTVPLAARSGGDTFRFLAISNRTTVTVDGVPIPGLLDQGEFHEVRLGKAAHVTANLPILVAQFAHSSDFDRVTNSDPFMVLIPPTRLFASSYAVETPPTGFAGNYVNLAAPAGTQVLLDGEPILAGWGPIGSSGYSGNQVSVRPGPHTLSTTNGVPFGVIVYGWNHYDAYGYPGGLCEAEAQGPRCDCPPANLVLELGTNCQTRIPDLKLQMGDCFSAGAILQEPLPDTLVGPGTYTISVTIKDPVGEPIQCSTTARVLPGGCPPSPGPDVGITLSATNLSLSFPVPPGRNYAVEYKTSLNSPEWNVLAKGVGRGTSVLVGDAISRLQSRFYRLKLE
jgi:hypothetical protein